MARQTFSDRPANRSGAAAKGLASFLSVKQNPPSLDSGDRDRVVARLWDRKAERLPNRQTQRTEICRLFESSGYPTAQFSDRRKASPGPPSKRCARITAVRKPARKIPNGTRRRMAMR